MDLLELKNTVSEIKNLVDEVQSSQDTAEKGQQLYIQTQGQREKGQKIVGQSERDM